MASSTSPAPLPEKVSEKGVPGAILKFLSTIPKTTERESRKPMDRARAIANTAAARAAIFSGSLALPPGPLSVLTIIPDLIGIWRIQAQMVADIAGAFGKETLLTREQMLYCLFRHAAAQIVRDLVARVGERVIVRRLPIQAISRIVEKIGLRVTHRMATKAVSRWIPVIGALGVGAYAYYDTAQVAKTTMELFQKEIDVEVEVERLDR